MKNSILRKAISLIIAVAFVFSLVTPVAKVQAQGLLGLPEPGTMVSLSPAFEPALIKGLTVHKDNPFLFDFIVDTGRSRMAGNELKAEGDRLIRYFFAALTIPDHDLWVNLSPYEKDRMIPQALGQTALGRDLLAQDYMLKQLTASLIYPEKELGRNFWDKVYSQARERFGTTDIPVNTFNKVWIVAEKASIYEHNQTAFIVSAHLKVMLEEDYISMQKHQADCQASDGLNVKASQGTNPLPRNSASQIIRKIILPALEQEVNKGQNFATLRQIFYSQILATWFKRNLKQALLAQVYADKSTVNGVNLKDPSVKELIYKRYLQAYKKGVFNFIKEDVDRYTNEAIPRKYFSGGYDSAQLAITPANFDEAKTAAKSTGNTVDFAAVVRTDKDAAMFSHRKVIISKSLTKASAAENLAIDIKDKLGPQAKDRLISMLGIMIVRQMPDTKRLAITLGVYRDEDFEKQAYKDAMALAAVITRLNPDVGLLEPPEKIKNPNNLREGFTVLGLGIKESVIKEKTLSTRKQKAQLDNIYENLRLAVNLISQNDDAMITGLNNTVLGLIMLNGFKNGDKVRITKNFDDTFSRVLWDDGIVKVKVTQNIKDGSWEIQYTHHAAPEDIRFPSNVSLGWDGKGQLLAKGKNEKGIEFDVTLDSVWPKNPLFDLTRDEFGTWNILLENDAAKELKVRFNGINGAINGLRVKMADEAMVTDLDKEELNKSAMGKYMLERDGQGSAEIKKNNDGIYTLTSIEPGLVRRSITHNSLNGGWEITYQLFSPDQKKEILSFIWDGQNLDIRFSDIFGNKSFFTKLENLKQNPLFNFIDGSRARIIFSKGINPGLLQAFNDKLENLRIPGFDLEAITEGSLEAMRDVPLGALKRIAGNLKQPKFETFERGNILQVLFDTTSEKDRDDAKPWVNEMLRAVTNRFMIIEKTMTRREDGAKLFLLVAGPEDPKIENSGPDVDLANKLRDFIRKKIENQLSQSEQPISDAAMFSQRIEKAMFGSGVTLPGLGFKRFDPVKVKEFIDVFLKSILRKPDRTIPLVNNNKFIRKINFPLEVGLRDTFMRWIIVKAPERWAFLYDPNSGTWSIHEKSIVKSVGINNIEELRDLLEQYQEQLDNLTADRATLAVNSVKTKDFYDITWNVIGRGIRRISPNRAGSIFHWFQKHDGEFQELTQNQKRAIIENLKKRLNPNQVAALKNWSPRVAIFEELLSSNEVSESPRTGAWLKVKRPDRAMTSPGGIDLNMLSDGLSVSKVANGGVVITVDPAMIERVRREGIRNATPVIINMRVLASLDELLGF